MFIIALLFALIIQTSDVKPRTVWDGVYTADQAARGQDTFDANCRGCHNREADLAGGEAHALKGEVFFDRWREDHLQSLLNKMKASMPPARARLAEDQYVDIISFLLRENAFPSGTQELKTNQLTSTRIEGSDGPQPLPNLALVKVIGCLTPAANNAWNLTSGTAPVRTRTPDETNPDEVKESASTPLGSQTFQLRALDGLANFDPASHNGQRIQTKGVLYTTQTPNRLTVISIEAVGATCTP